MLLKIILLNQKKKLEEERYHKESKMLNNVIIEMLGEFKLKNKKDPTKEYLEKKSKLEKKYQILGDKLTDLKLE